MSKFILIQPDLNSVPPEARVGNLSVGRIVSMEAEASQASIMPAFEPLDEVRFGPPGLEHAPTNDRAEGWGVAGCVIVLAILGGAGGLWGWTFAEFVHLLVETIPGVPIRFFLEN